MITSEPLLPKTAFHDWLIALRRHFHQFPELAFQEIKTSAKICEVLQELNIPFQSGIGGTGIIARIRAKHQGQMIAFRADMDALPIQEPNDIPYKSKHEGIMHACGHDAHMTIALGVIRKLLDSDWYRAGSGEILFVFQPAEEKGSGALCILDALGSEPIQAIFAGHLHPESPVGHIGIADDYSNASADTFRIVLTGKGGHGAHPQQCKDIILIGAHFLTQLQGLISREISAMDNAVLTIGKFHAGSASNIIPEEAVLEGTLRTFKDAVREKILKRMKSLLHSLEVGYGISAFLTFWEGCPAVINDPQLVCHVRKYAKEILGQPRVYREAPRMGAEDFSFFAKRYPGLMIGLGCHDPEKGFLHGLHSPDFNFDERILDVGVILIEHILTRYLGSPVNLEVG